MESGFLQVPRKAAYKILLKDFKCRKKQSGAPLAFCHLPSDKAYVTEIVNEIKRWQKLLDYMIEKVSLRKKRFIKPDILIALRLGFYFLLLDVQMPDYAAVDESVSLLSDKKAKGFINAVLRKYIRLKGNYEFPEGNTVKDIAITYSHPEWFVSYVVDAFRKDKALSIFEANNSVPPVWLRLNSLKIKREEFEGRLREMGVEFERDSEFDFLYQTSHIRELLLSPLFKEGAFYVQDKTTVLPCAFLSKFSGNKVLDVCSAPGGKATLISQLGNNKVKVTCIDKTKRKTDLIRENVKRLSVKNIDVVECDFLKRCDKISNKEFSRVMLDVPCSNTGVWRRRPDARWLFTRDRLNSIAKIQKKMLEKAFSFLSKNGILVYSTCSILDVENKNIVEDFLYRNADARLITEKLTIQEKKGADGGYFAAIRRS
ncbi:MAG: transcription antitermination factor NusB [Candidatus Auribacterota bacterium]|nr:transcription antitermination factor NusB [Candidatus Auribacterota bacterium]